MDYTWLSCVVQKYNGSQTRFFRSPDAESKYLKPIGLSMDGPTSEFNNKLMDHDHEKQHFQALHFLKFKLSQKKLETIEEHHLFALFLAVRNKIISSNMGLVYKCMNLCHVAKYSKDDEHVQSAASLCLIQCVENFDPYRNFKFSTYACTSIVRRILKTLAQRSEPIAYELALESQVFSPPENSKQELAIDRVRQLLNFPKRAGLTKIEFDIIVKRFGIPKKNKPVATKFLRELGREYGVSSERIRQIEHGAIGKLRQALIADPHFA